MALLEVAIDSLADGLAALEAGADRLEVCSSLDEGGCTPVEEVFKELRRTTQKPLFAMIRPRGGSFEYSLAEKSEMLSSMRVFAGGGVDGFVFGALDAGSRVDSAFVEEVMGCAGSLPCTFHRAFDRSPMPFDDLAILMDAGIRRILTSGGKATAEEGIPALRAYVDQAKDRIMILPGGGVRETNVERILHDTGTREIHTSGRDGRNMLDAGMVTLIAGIAHIS